MYHSTQTDDPAPSADLNICLQWHVTPAALDRWHKYKDMIGQDAAKVQQRGQQPASEAATAQAVPQGKVEQQIVSPHTAGAKRTADDTLAGEDVVVVPKTKKQHVASDTQCGTSGLEQRQQQQQQQQAVQCGVAPPSGDLNHSLGFLPDEDGSDLNDTVGAIVVNATGKSKVGLHLLSYGAVIVPSLQSFVQCDCGWLQSPVA